MIAVEKLPQQTAVDLHRSTIDVAGDETEWEVACEALEQRLGEELRAAKSAQLSCGEVLLPADLLPTVSRQILVESEKEPCGLRGCTLDIQLETEDGSQMKISSIKCDPEICSTFLLSLTLHQDTSHKWGLTRLFKTLTKGRTLVIGDRFLLTKTRLYRPRAPAC